MKSRQLYLALLVACLAQAQVTPELAAKFLEEQLLERYPSVAGEKIAIVPLLRAAPPADPMSIVPPLAKRWKAPETGTAKAIEAIMLDEVGEHFWLEKSRELRDRISRLYHEAVLESPDSRAIWTLGISRIAEDGRCEDLALRNAYFDRPFAESTFLSQDACDQWNIEYVRRFPHSLLGRIQLQHTVGYHDPAAEIAAIRWALDGLEARRETGELTQAIRQWHWNLLAMRGLGEELLNEVANADQSSTIFAKPNKKELGVDDKIVLNDWSLTTHAAGARAGWMLALLEAGRADEARSAYDATLDGDGVVKDALFGNTKDDLFTRYLQDQEKSLLWKGVDTRLAQRAAARFLAANGMESSARFVAARACNKSPDDSSGSQMSRELATLPQEFRTYHERYTRLIAAADVAAQCPVAAPKKASSARLPRYPEIPLTAEERAQPVLPPLDEKIPLPPSFGLLRAERLGDAVLALCESTAVDPSGEVGTGGYWLLRSRDGGKIWDAPRYLGLQARSPYLAKSEARLSMFAGDALRIEADVAELDPESITFPPVMLRSRREVPDIRIDIPFAVIDRDADGDGWTDLLEAKLHTDPAKADTDGDGLSDPFDDFPHASARGTPDPDASLIVDILRRVVGMERAGIVEPVGSKSTEQRFTGMRRVSAGSVLFQIVVGDVERFTGLRAESQVIVLSETQLSEIRATSGPFYPLHFPEILFDAKRERAVVEWSAGWVGGTLLYRKVNGRWKGKEVSRWITRVAPAPNTSPG
jgi:hypothetical protein